MKIISFAWTTQALLDGKKTVTRRTWDGSYAERFQKGDVVSAYNKSPRNDGKKVAEIIITDIYKEWLSDMPESDLKEEGGLWASIDQFIEGFGGDKEVWVIRFKVMSYV